jgi:protein SCO1/2
LAQVLLGVTLGLLGVLLWLSGKRPAATPWEGSEDPFQNPPGVAPEFVLRSQHGTLVSSEDFPGKLLVVFFGYTFCPDVCPLTLSTLTRAFDQLGDGRERVQVILITVDPARDTAERLKSYLFGFHPSFIGLTGSEEEIRSVAHGFGAEFAKSGEGQSYTVDHTARVFVVDPDGRIPLTFPITATPEEIVRDLSRLIEASTGGEAPDRRGP